MVKRKKYLVLIKFQLTLVSVNILTLIICMTFFIIQNRFAFKAMRELGERSQVGIDERYFRFIAMQERAFSKYLIFTTLIASFISLVATVIYSHRVVGPMQRLIDYFSEIRESGKLPEKAIQIRKSDYFKELILIIQEACEALVKSTKTRREK